MMESKKNSSAPGSIGWSEDYFESFDGARLFARFFDPPKVRHTLVILHGYGEHTGRYLKFSEKLKTTSVRLALFDYRGMGRSGDGSPEARSVAEYLKDVDAFLGHFRRKYKFKNEIILLGHSLGGLLAAEWAMKHPAEVKRLILSAPFLDLPGRAFLHGVNTVATFLMPRHVYRNPVTPGFLSHDAGEVAAYRADPLIRRSISARLIGSLMDAMALMKRKETVTMPFPVHILVAGAERIVSPTAARRFFDRLVAPKKEFTEFEGFFHEIFNEAGQDRAFNVLKTILNECV